MICNYLVSQESLKAAAVIIHSLIDIISKGGNLLLNVGPTAEGLIPSESVERLRSKGKWTKANSESIYGAKASPYNKPEWGRYTSKPGVLYAHVFNWTEDGRLLLNEDIKVKRASLLTSSEIEIKIEKNQFPSSLIQPENINNSIATVIKLKLQ